MVRPLRQARSHPIISGTPEYGVPTAGISRNFMILYRLRCSQGHEFEGWFKDSKTYERQEKKSLIGCAVCGDGKVERALMAPRLGKGGKKVEVVLVQRPRATERAVDHADDLLRLDAAGAQAVGDLGRLQELLPVVRAARQPA